MTPTRRAVLLPAPPAKPTGGDGTGSEVGGTAADVLAGTATATGTAGCVTIRWTSTGFAAVLTKALALAVLAVLVARNSCADVAVAIVG